MFGRKKTSLVALAVLGIVSLHSSLALAGEVTQMTSPASSDAYWYSTGWTPQDLGSVTLAKGTSSILSLTSIATLVDQGWGNQCNCNGVYINLIDNGVNLASWDVAGAQHTVSTQTFSMDATTNPNALNLFNTALSGINWSTNQNVKLDLTANLYAYSGWELHTSNASFTVTSISAVPEPTESALMLSGIAMLGFIAARRKKSA